MLAALYCKQAFSCREKFMAATPKEVWATRQRKITGAKMMNDN